MRWYTVDLYHHPSNCLGVGVARDFTPPPHKPYQLHAMGFLDERHRTKLVLGKSTFYRHALNSNLSP